MLQTMRQYFDSLAWSSDLKNLIWYFIIVIFVWYCNIWWARVAQSVQRLPTGWTVRGSNPGGGEIFRTCPDRPWSPSSLLYNGYPVFPGSKERPERDADPSHSSSKSKGKAVPLQAWSVPEGSRKLRFPYFMTTAQDGGKVVGLTHRSSLPHRKYTWYSFLLEAESTPGS